MQPGEAVRLGNGDDAAVGGAARRLQHRRYLDRMVTVIVEDIDAVPGPGMGEAALDAGEGRQALLDRLAGQAELMRDGDGCGGVGDIVTAGHRQAQA